MSDELSPKTCNSCNETKELEHFSRHAKSRGGREARCKACLARWRKWRRAEEAGPVLGHKTCSACGTVQPLEDFHSARNNSDGRRSRCKDCDRKDDEHRRKECEECRRVLSFRVFSKGDRRCRTCRNGGPQSGLRPKKGHSISGVNDERKEGLCSECGPVSVKADGRGYWKCANMKHDGRLRYNHGITLAEFNAKLAEQNGVCQICKKTNASGRNLSQDHNHETGALRDLLCSPCNTALGLAQECVETLQSMIDYLIKHQAP